MTFLEDLSEEERNAWRQACLRFDRAVVRSWSARELAAVHDLVMAGQHHGVAALVPVKPVDVTVQAVIEEMQARKALSGVSRETTRNDDEQAAA